MTLSPSLQAEHDRIMLHMKKFVSHLIRSYAQQERRRRERANRG